MMSNNVVTADRNDGHSYTNKTGVCSKLKSYLKENNDPWNLSSFTVLFCIITILRVNEVAKMQKDHIINYIKAICLIMNSGVHSTWEKIRGLHCVRVCVPVCVCECMCE